MRIARRHEHALYEDEGPSASASPDEIRKRIRALRITGARVNVRRVDEELYSGRP